MQGFWYENRSINSIQNFRHLATIFHSFMLLIFQLIHNFGMLVEKVSHYPFSVTYARVSFATKSSDKSHFSLLTQYKLPLENWHTNCSFLKVLGSASTCGVQVTMDCTLKRHSKVKSNKMESIIILGVQLQDKEIFLFFL